MQALTAAYVFAAFLSFCYPNGRVPAMSEFVHDFVAAILQCVPDGDGTIPSHTVTFQSLDIIDGKICETELVLLIGLLAICTGGIRRGPHMAYVDMRACMP